MSLNQGQAEWLVENWAPGFLDTPASDALPAGATPDARNGELTSIALGPAHAQLQKRRGSRLLAAAPMVAATKVDGLWEVRRVGATAQLVAVCGGRVFAYNGTDAFAQVGTTIPFTAGTPARVCVVRQHALIHDGTAMRRYDGTTLDEVGVAAPTGVTNMSAGTGTLTGTFEAYYVWYDQTTDHESSPSATTAPLTLTAQGRTHTRPTSTPPARVTHWRAYVRRTDTNEFSFFRAATVAVGTLTATETTSDTARVDVGPRPNANDPPPAFAILVEHQGYGFGIQANDDRFWVSKQGDIESWHPKDIFTVSRAGGEPLTCARPYGADLLVQKPHATWRVVGDTLPFRIEPLHSQFGCVSQEAAVEVGGRYYAWDRVKGPYRTDTVDWTPLADYRIRTLVSRVNQAALSDIRCAHDEINSLILWAVPIAPATRKRMILAYHYGLDVWLPPWTGLEYGSLAAFTEASGSVGVFCGDLWGRVFRLLDGTTEGIDVSATPTPTVRVPVTSSTANSVTSSGATFPTAGSGLAGLPVAVVSPAGLWQWRRILSNTGTSLTLDTTNDAPWATLPTTDYELIVGGIDWYQWTPLLDFNASLHEKRLGVLTLKGRSTRATASVRIVGRFDENTTNVDQTDHAIGVGASQGVWGALVWGTGVWGASGRRIAKLRIDRVCLQAQFQLSNPYPDEPIEITAFGVNADVLPRRRVES